MACSMAVKLKSPKIIRNIVMTDVVKVRKSLHWKKFEEGNEAFLKSLQSSTVENIDLQVVTDKTENPDKQKRIVTSKTAGELVGDGVSDGRNMTSVTRLGYFWKVQLNNKFYYKNGQNIWQLFEKFLKASLFKSNFVATYWATFRKNGLFFITTSGYTAGNLIPHVSIELLLVNECYIQSIFSFCLLSQSNIEKPP